jgi:hypothetical protein
VKGPVPDAVVQNWFVRPSQIVTGESAVAATFVLAVRVAQRWTGVPQAPETVTH